MRWLAVIALAWALILAPGQAKADYDRHFRKSAKRFFGLAVDWRWFKAQAKAESGLNPRAVSPVGAKGLMQLMPFTSKQISRKLGLNDLPFDPRTNILMGICYDRWLWDQWSAKRTKTQRLELMFASYNAGLGHILKAQKIAREKGACFDLWPCLAPLLSKVTGRNAKETIGYVARIKGFMKKGMP